VDGRQARRLSEALLDAFAPQRLDEMLFYRLSKDRARITMAGNYETIVYDLIRAAHSEGWLDRLVVAARQSRPEHPGLRAVAEGRGLTASAPALESILSESAPEIHPAQWRARLGVLEGQVGRIEANGRALGTGFLVGPDLCLTSHHVVAKLFGGGLSADALRLRLDYKKDADGEEIFPGTEVKLAPDWEAASSPTDELDFALLRLDGEPGEEPLGGTGEPAAAARGWIRLPAAAEARAGQDIVVLQHLLGGPVQMRFGKVTELAGGRLKHTADTEAGSSGSPCFTLDWELVAVHQAGDVIRESWQRPQANQAVPIGPIAARVPGG
jgi:V8-like Glu-specific endopeptidase